MGSVLVLCLRSCGGCGQEKQVIDFRSAVAWPVSPPKAYLPGKDASSPSLVRVAARSSRAGSGVLTLRREVSEHPPPFNSCG